MGCGALVLLIDGRATIEATKSTEVVSETMVAGSCSDSLVNMNVADARYPKNKVMSELKIRALMQCL